MANIKFYGTKNTGTDNTSVNIRHVPTESENLLQVIIGRPDKSISSFLDVDTAVQLVKHLRKEIAKAKGQEGV